MTQFVAGDEKEFHGPAGSSFRVPIESDMRNASEGICTWLLYAPSAHPLWQYFDLFVIRLRQLPGMPPPNLAFEGANHEIGVLSLDPEYQPYDVKKLIEIGRSSGIPYLLPQQVAVQFECTDEEANLLGTYAARGVAYGHLIPEDQLSGDAQRYWLGTLVKTLAHIRGEEHAK